MHNASARLPHSSLVLTSKTLTRRHLFFWQTWRKSTTCCLYPLVTILRTVWRFKLHIERCDSFEYAVQRCKDLGTRESFSMHFGRKPTPLPSSGSESDNWFVTHTPCELICNPWSCWRRAMKGGKRKHTFRFASPIFFCISHSILLIFPVPHLTIEYIFHIIYNILT